MLRLISVFTALIAIAWPVAAERVGLVLSGGGARGIAHVGVIKALEDNDIPIDYITGTSMGAIVGSLYACGYTPEQMMRLFTSRDFADWSSGKLDRKQIFYYSEPDPTPKLVNVNFSKPDSANIFNYIPTNLISPMPMNLEFLRLYAPYTLQCGQDFDRLFVPFRCVTSDIYHKHKVVCRGGSLSNSVRQSMSFPLVFKPIKRNGVLVYDGGIYDNFPVDVMTEDFHPDVIIGSNVSKPDGPPQPDNVYSQLEDMIIQNNDYSLPESLGIKIDVPVTQYAVLEFGKAQEIYEAGYKKGLEMIPEIKARIKARRSADEVARRRREFASATPEVRFNKIQTENCPAPQSEYLKYIFNPRDSITIGMPDVERAYYRIVSTGMISDLEPGMEPQPDGNILTLQPQVNDRWNLGLGGWLTSTNNNTLYLSASYRTLRFNALDASVKAWLGQSYQAIMADARMELQRHIASYIKLSGVMSHTHYYNDRRWFYEIGKPSYVTMRENYIKMSYYRALTLKSVAFGSIGYAYDLNKFYGDTYPAEGGRDRSENKTVAATIGAQGSTLNRVMYPDCGWAFRATASLMYRHNRYIPSLDDNPHAGTAKGMRGLVKADWQRYFEVMPNLSVGAAANGVMTIGRLDATYMATLLGSQQFAPVPSLKDYFNSSMLSPNYLAIGAIPVWKPISNLQLRGDFYLYNPVRNIRRLDDGGVEYRGWLKHTRFLGQVAAVYNLPKGAFSIYANYISGQRRGWNFGVNFGLIIPAPGFFD